MDCTIREVRHNHTGKDEAMKSEVTEIYIDKGSMSRNK